MPTPAGLVQGRGGPGRRPEGRPAADLFSPPSGIPSIGRVAMVRWALVFFVVALVAAGFGFGGLAGEAAMAVKALAFVFLTMAAVSLVTSRALPAPAADERRPSSPMRAPPP